MNKDNIEDLINIATLSYDSAISVIDMKIPELLTKELTIWSVEYTQHDKKHHKIIFLRRGSNTYIMHKI